MKVTFRDQKLRGAAVFTKSVFIYADNFYQQVMSVSSFGAHVLVTMATNILQGALTLLTGVMVARLLGPDGRGELAVIQSWAPLFATVAMLGLPEAVTYFSGRHPDQAGRYWISGTIFALVVGIPLCMVGFWLMPWLLIAQASSVISVAQWYVIGLALFFALHWTLLASLRGRNDFAVWNALQLLPTVGWLVVLLLAMFFKHRTPQFIALGYIAMLGLIFPLAAAVVVRRIPGPFHLEPRLFHPMMRYGSPLAMATLPQWLWNARLPQILMASFLEPRSLGLFAVAISWGNMAGPLSHAIGTVLFPHVASRSTGDEKSKALARGVQLSVLLTASLSIFLIILSPLGIPALFGTEFSPAIPAAMVMVGAGGTMGIKTALDQGLRGLGRPGVILVSELIGLAVTGALFPFLLFHFNIIGAAIATLIASGSTVVCLIVQTHRLGRIPLGRLLYPNTSEVLALRARFHALRHNLIVGQREGR